MARPSLSRPGPARVHGGFRACLVRIPSCPNHVPTTRSSTSDRTRRRRRIWPWVLGIVGLLIAGLVVAGFFAAKFVDEALDVRADLEAAKSRLGNVTELVRSGDQAQFDAVATEVLAYTSSADEKVQGPLWEFASWVPFVGQNVAAVRATTEATHILVRDALPRDLPRPRRDAAGEHPLRRRRLQPRAVPSGRSARSRQSMRRSPRLRQKVAGHRPRRAASDRRRRRRPGASR